MQIDEPIRKCAHGVYHPFGQKIAHGCYLCNPALSQPVADPSLNAQKFLFLNSADLAGFKLMAYDTEFEMGPKIAAEFSSTDMGVPRMLTRLAPAPDRAELHYNSFQFGEQKSNRVASESSRLSFEDRDGMYRENGPSQRARRWIPEWTQNASALRLVIMVHLFSYIRHGGNYKRGGVKLPSHLENDFKALAAEADKYFVDVTSHARPKKIASPTQKAMFNSHVTAVRRAGSYAALVSAIAYRSFRLRWNSPQIAEEMGVSPTMVRQQIFRLRETARALRLESPDKNRHWTAGVRLAPRRVRLIKRRMRSAAKASKLCPVWE